MTVFKFFLMAFIMATFALVDTASAQVVRRGPRYNPPGGPISRPFPGPRPAPRPVPRFPEQYPQGRVTCSASDRGWEEHWGSHGSCGACLQQHNECVETCVEQREQCEVQGTDYQGRQRRYVAVGFDRYSAEAEARRQCEWDRNNSSCYTLTCRSDNRTVSSRSCR